MHKLKTIQNHLKQHQIDMVLITNPDNIFYLSHFQSNPHERLLGVMIFQEAEPLIICPQMEILDAATNWTYEIVGYLDTENAWAVLTEAVKSRGITPNVIAIEKSHMTVERLETLEQFFPQAHFTKLDDTMNAMRVIKDPEELANLRQAAKLADYAIEIACREITEGKTELEILMNIEKAIQEKGYTMSFDTMVLSGAKTASPHGTPGNRKIQKGDMILLDLGVIYNGYCSDITRTVAFGCPSEEQITIYNTVRTANEQAIATVKPGIRAMDLDKIARNIITAAGYGEYFTHRLGHGLGISVHEFPSITSTNDMLLEKNMVFTIEPGIYKTGIAGVRIEDDVVVTSEGVEVLTKFPKELIIIE